MYRKEYDRQAQAAYQKKNRPDPQFRARQREHGKKQRQRHPERILERARTYRAANAQKVQDYQREYSARNASEKAAKARAWREAHPLKSRESAKASYDKNREAIIARQNARHREKMASDAGYAINSRMSSALRSALRDKKAGRSWEALVGFSLNDLMRHLEKQFIKGMTWANRGDWHIDHIRPLATFKYETETDPEFHEAWALTNLRPLWGKENFSKGARRLLLI